MNVSDRRKSFTITKTGFEVANEARMLLHGHKGSSVLIVEGPNDKKLFSKFITEPTCFVLIALGKSAASTAANPLRQSNTKGYLIIVDADFDHLRQNANLPHNDLIETEFHDLDTVVFESAALEKLLSRMADEVKLRSVAPTAADVRKRVYQAALGLGCLRYLSEEHAWGLSFEDLDGFSFIDRRTLSSNDNKMVDIVITKSREIDRCRPQIVNLIAQTVARGHDPRQVCNGHDVADVLAIALQVLLGNLEPSESRRFVVESELRSAFDAAAFRASGLFRAIREWEEANPGYLVLTPS
jgi:hypothetical protein